MEFYRSQHLPLSKLTKPFDLLLKNLIEKYKNLWWESQVSWPNFPNTYSPQQQKMIEQRLAQFVEAIAKSLEVHARQKNNVSEMMLSLFDQTKESWWKLTQSSGLYFSEPFNDGIKRSTKTFLEKIKQYDPAIELKYIYQAIRNLWIMNSLQLYLKVDMTCSDSMFGYSMLYPYTDNLMDDVSKSREEKLAMHGKLKKWLEGEECAPQVEQEKKIFNMVQLIENEFARNSYPLVFPSILTIFNAQLKSLSQQKKDALPYETDILDISFEKGGSSVLADGFLLTGELDERQMDFCFAYGAFLQFADDIQDVVNDKQTHQMTIFSQLAGTYPLDSLVNKLLNFITTIGTLHLSAPVHEGLRKIILSNCYFLVLRSIGKNKQFFGKKYVQEIENHFPMHFNYFADTQKRLAKIFRKYRTASLTLDTLINFFTYLNSDKMAAAIPA